MARLLHDPQVRDDIRARIQKVRPDAQRRWGTMSVDQMMWHLSQGLTAALGRADPGRPAKVPPLPKPVLKFLVLSAPWPKGAPTLPGFVAKGTYSLEDERQRCLSLLDEFCGRNINATDWAVHPILGKMSGQEHSRLHAKHLDHHLKQFGT